MIRERVEESEERGTVLSNLLISAGSGVSGEVGDFSGMNFGGVHGHVSAVVAVIVRMVPGNVGDDSVLGSGIAVGAEMFHLGGIDFGGVHLVLSPVSPVVGSNPVVGPTVSSGSVSGHVSGARSGNLRGLGDLGRNGTSQKENGGNLKGPTQS